MADVPNEHAVTDMRRQSTPRRLRVGAFERPVSPEARRARRPDILVIGASTGGPQALMALIAELAPALPTVSVCVTLHMPRDLMPVVAGHIARNCGVGTKIVDAPCLLEAGLVHFAPGDKHLDFRRTGAGVEIFLRAAPSKTYCRPAVDAMFNGAARVFGARTLGIVLSGMGEDGLSGARAIDTAGGVLLVQDKRSSAVWGMPGAIVKAGLATAILPPTAIGSEVVRRLRANGLVP